MIDLNRLKEKVQPSKTIYFAPGKYTAKINKVTYVERQDADDLYAVMFEIVDVAPGGKHSVGDIVSWGKKINENNIISIADFIMAAKSPDGDLNNSIDTEENVSNIKGNLVCVDVTESSWNGKPYYNASFVQHTETPTFTTSKPQSWKDLPPWDNNVKPF